MENPVKIAFKAVGGRTKAAEIINRSYQAVKKMEDKGVLPRTEYTNETQYAQTLADHSNGAFTAAWLLENANPIKQTI
ncbi:hypothetical protein [Acinetobacter sp. CFCC 10889]|uniref:hypothetical protein n=1 Tax=Acinetobacter sp. CFCC 10889 TaxID=1775557 RepID=UPI000DD0D1A0|nr:hypothetical protein [Acinetobacter sp. CFCC 10889]